LSLGWFPLILIYIVTNSASKILQKIAVRKDEIDPNAFCVAFFFYCGLLTVPFLALEPIRLAPDYRGWLAFGFSCVGACFCMVFYYYSIKRIEVSQAETIATTRSIWAVLLGIVFFHETLSASKLIGIVLIISAIASIYWKKGTVATFRRPQWMIVAYAFLITAAYALDKFALDYFSVIFYQLILYWVSGALTLLFFPGTLKKMRPFLHWNRHTPLYLLCFILQAISTLAFLRSFQVGGDLSVVGPMAQTTTLLTILIGIIFLKEHWNLKRKLSGVALAAIGIIFLRVFSF